MKFFKKIILILLSIISLANVFSGLPPQTMVFMGNGAYKRVKDMVVGDYIPVYDIPTHQLEKQKRKVQEISSRKAKDIVLIEMGDEKVIAGINQKLYNRSIKKFITAKEFKVGDDLFSPEKGNLTITKIVLVKLDDAVELYDIALEDGNLFLILTDKQTHILVHNFAFAIPIFTWVFGEGFFWIGWEALITALGFAAVGHLCKDKIPGLEDVLKGVKPEKNTRGKSKVFKKNGGKNQKDDDFNKLNKVPEWYGKSKDGDDMRFGQTQNGDTIVDRDFSSDTSGDKPTLEIQHGKNRIKIRYDN